MNVWMANRVAASFIFQDDLSLLRRISASEEIIAELSIVFIGATIIYLTATLIRRRQQHAMQRHMLDKFSNTQDFASFVQSEAGQRYIMGFTDQLTSPQNPILSSVRIGCVCLFSGVALTISGQRFNVWVLDTVGLLILMGGAGFLVSAVASYFVARKLNAGLKE